MSTIVLRGKLTLRMAGEGPLTARAFLDDRDIMSVVHQRIQEGTAVSIFVTARRVTEGVERCRVTTASIIAAYSGIDVLAHLAEEFAGRTVALHISTAPQKMPVVPDDPNSPEPGADGPRLSTSQRVRLAGRLGREPDRCPAHPPRMHPDVRL